MAVIRLTKIFRFDMAHALLGYDGLCKNIHGHSYVLHVTVSGKPLDQKGHPKDGMVMDFKVLKDIVKNKVIKQYDHALVLHEDSPDLIKNSLSSHYDRVIIAPFQPTCEMLVIHFSEIIKDELAPGLSLHSLKLYETDTSYAEWRAEENE